MNETERQFTWSPVDLFRFSAFTGNAHRIHYDVDHARSEGFDSVLVHTTLHAEMLWQALTDLVGEDRVLSFEWRNHAPLQAGQTVRVVAVQRDDAVHLKEVRVDDEVVVCSGTAALSSSSVL